ncbi:MAG: hypothetical protein R3E58_17645 [Phycisphaerae bacterium]
MIGWPVGVLEQLGEVSGRNRTCVISGVLTGEDDFGHDASKAFWTELVHGPTPPVKMVTPMGVCVNRDGSKVAVADVNDHSIHVFDLVAKISPRRSLVGKRTMNHRWL